MEDHDYLYRKTQGENMIGVSYSPTKLIIRADEIEQRGAVKLADGEIRPFISIIK